MAITMSATQHAGPGFSIASLMAHIGAISNRTTAALAELGVVLPSALELNHGRELRQLGSVAEQMSQFGGRMHDLEGALTAATVISIQLQAALKHFLAQTEDWTAVVGKQLMRLQADNIARIDMSVVTTFEEALATHTRLFAIFVNLLQLAEGNAQSAAFEEEMSAEMLENTNLAAQFVIRSTSILHNLDGSKLSLNESDDLKIDAKTLNHSLNTDESLPSYESIASSSTAPTPSSSVRPGSNQATEGSWLTNSLKAFAAGFSRKPSSLATALCHAAARNHIQQMAGLVQQGADVSARNEQGETALECAISSDSKEAIRFLLASGVDWQKSYSGLPPLFLAAKGGNTELAKLFMDNGADVNEKSMAGHPYLCSLVEKGGSLAGFEFLLENGGNPNMKSMTGQPLLATTVKADNIDFTGVLINHGADINSKDITGESLLSLALRSRRPQDMVELLIRHGADVNSKTLTGVTVLANTIARRQTALATILVAHGADVNAKQITGQPMIMTILSGGYPEPERIELLRLMLDHGADVNAKDITGRYTPLRYAMQLNSVETVRLLLRGGADPDRAMHGGESFLLHAVTRGQKDVAEALLAHDADANARDRLGRTPFTLAISRQDFELARLLKKHGAKVDAKVAFLIQELAVNRPDILEMLN